MIRQIDIKRFGSFQDLDWRRDLRDKGNNVATFKKLNIIYGRNYSGKTTFSRIFRSLEEGKLPWNHDHASFTVRGDKFEINLQGLSSHALDIRVYNRDFVSDNLSFLSDNQAGQIKTFAIVGGENNRVVEEISRLNSQLGSIESKKGARFDAFRATERAQRARGAEQREREDIDGRLRKHANLVIKKDRLIGQAVYNIDHIKADIQVIQNQRAVPLDEDAKALRVDLLKQDALATVVHPSPFPENLDTLRSAVGGVVSRAIAPSEALQDLLADPKLQAWVKEGVQHHKGVRHTCAFCRQDLPANLWKVLSSHFSKESEDLERDIEAQLTAVRTEIGTVSALSPFKPSDFYASERAALARAQEQVNRAYTGYLADLKALEGALIARKLSLFTPVDMPPPKFHDSEATSAVDALKEVIIKNNEKTKTLIQDKEAARAELRRDNVLAFIKAMDLDGANKKIAELVIKTQQARNDEQAAIDEEKRLNVQVRALEIQLKDERKGAERVNEYLSHFFGHDSLRLNAVEQGGASGVKFQITRGGVPAYHLSEGECSLIAFCYFMARLEAPESSGKDLIVYIDDPISSLDSNHIFFMFSLIETLIAKPSKGADGSNQFRYRQLFISTHNLDFLKYLKKLTAPKNDHEYFLVERHGEKSSRLSLMPSHLKDYVTEFNYLFHQIYKCSDRVPSQGDNEHFYSFGNNLRNL